MWKFCGKAQFRHSFGQFHPKLCEKCPFPQNFYTRKLREITLFHEVNNYRHEPMLKYKLGQGFLKIIRYDIVSFHDVMKKACCLKKKNTFNVLHKKLKKRLKLYQL